MGRREFKVVRFVGRMVSGDCVGGKGAGDRLWKKGRVRTVCHQCPTAVNSVMFEQSNSNELQEFCSGNDLS